MRKPAAGHLYVLELSDDLVKVGFAGFPDGRIAQHRFDLGKRGVQITRSWVSPKHFEAYLNEELLIAACAELGAEARFGKEWFSGLRFEDAVAAAKSIPFTELAGDDTQTLEHARSILGEIVEQARLAREPTTITRHGKPAAVVVNAGWHAAAETTFSLISLALEDMESGLEWQSVMAALKTQRDAALGHPAPKGSTENGEKS